MASQIKSRPRKQEHPEQHEQLPSSMDRLCELRAPEAERGLLSSILLLPVVLDDVATKVSKDDFYEEQHRLMFAAMTKLYGKRGGKVDVTLLIEALRTNGDLEICGGLAYIGEVVRAESTPAYASMYAQIVHDKAMLRRVVIESMKTIESAYSGEDASKVIEALESRAFALRDSHAKAEEQILDIDSIASKHMDALAERLTGSVTYIKTGLIDLDAVLKIGTDDFLILAARPSMGKSALAMNIAGHVARSRPVYVVSLEMGDVNLADRLMASEGQIVLGELLDGKADARRVNETWGKVSQEMRMEIDVTPGVSVAQIAASARKIKRKYKDLGLIVIDYLQLIEPEDSKAPREQQVAKMSRRLKLLSRELHTPILCLAQLNRQTEQGTDNRPRMRNLRESGSIEQDADVVLFVHREEYYARNDNEKREHAGKAELILSKQRNGKANITVHCFWQEQYQRFVSKAKAITQVTYDSSFDNGNW